MASDANDVGGWPPRLEVHKPIHRGKACALPTPIDVRFCTISMHVAPRLDSFARWRPLAIAAAMSARGEGFEVKIYLFTRRRVPTRHTGRAYTRGTYSRVHTQTQTNAQRGPTKYIAASGRGRSTVACLRFPQRAVVDSSVIRVSVAWVTSAAIATGCVWGNA